MPDELPFFDPAAEWTPLHPIERSRLHTPNPVPSELLEPEVEVKPNVFSVLGSWYCRTFHKSISTVFRGKYKCWKCLREYPSSYQ